MSYKPILTRSFIKEFGKLPENVKKRILDALNKVVETPYAGTKLLGKLEGLWRWRIGKYRVVYLVDERRKTVAFIDVGLRKTVYE